MGHTKSLSLVHSSSFVETLAEEGQAGALSPHKQHSRGTVLVSQGGQALPAVPQGSPV